MSRDYPRPLTEGEVALLKGVFGNGLNYGDIRIDVGGIPATEDHGQIAITHYDKMKFPEPPEDFSLSDVRNRAWLIHEVVHVWQWQQYKVDTYEKGSQLWVSEEGDYDAAYKWSLSDEFPDMNIEQQASAVASRYLVNQGFDPRDEVDWHRGEPLPSLSAYDVLLRPFYAQNEKGPPPHRKIPYGWDRNEDGGGGFGEACAPVQDIPPDIEEEREKLNLRLQEIYSIIDAIDAEGLIADEGVIDEFLDDLDVQLDILDTFDGADLLDRLRSLTDRLNEWRSYFRKQLESETHVDGYSLISSDDWQTEERDGSDAPPDETWEEDADSDLWVSEDEPDSDPDDAPLDP